MPRSRGPFNITMNLWSQVNGLPALAPYAVDIPCRYVVQDQITPVTFPHTTRVAWVTYDAAAPTQPIATVGLGTVSTDYWNADRIELSLFPGVLWAQILTEIVVPVGEPTYIRTWIGAPWYAAIGP